MFRMLVLKPLQMDRLMGRVVSNLSGGELQRVAVARCLGQSGASVFLIDEPSAGLDCEQRVVVASVIRRWVVDHLHAAAVVVEHDLLMTAAICDETVALKGRPGVECTAGELGGVQAGLDGFLKTLGITVRSDSSGAGRPRINKFGGQRDQEQKSKGLHYDCHK